MIFIDYIFNQICYIYHNDNIDELDKYYISDEYNDDEYNDDEYIE